MSISRRNLLLLFAGTAAISATQAKEALADTANADFDYPETLSSEGASCLPDDIAGIRDQADSLGISDVDFDNLSIGDGIPTYVFTGGSFDNGPSCFPILENGKVVFWILETESGIQVTNGLVSEVKDIITSESEIAFLYDKTTAYLYNYQDSSYTELIKYPDMPDRGTIDTSHSPEIETASYGEGDELPAWPSTRAYNAYSGFAIYGAWSYGSGTGHATVIRGINSSESLSLMDPLTSSFTTANRSGGTWTAQNAGTGASMSLVSTTMRYT